MKYIVTNATPGGNYTPSLFVNKEDAVLWMKECAARNIVDVYEYEDEFEEEFDEDFLDELDYTKEEDTERIFEWAKENHDVEISENKIGIYYDDDSYNIIQLFEVKENK